MTDGTIKVIDTATGEVVATLLTNHSMTKDEILEVCDIQVARTEEEYANVPENEMYFFEDLEIC